MRDELGVTVTATARAEVMAELLSRRDAALREIDETTRQIIDLTLDRAVESLPPKRKPGRPKKAAAVPSE